MKYNPNAHHRKSIRIKNYDYSTPGVYFITICIKGRENKLGTIQNKKMHPNKYAEIVENCITKIPQIYNKIEIDKYIIMPNHVHMIIIINNTEQRHTYNPKTISYSDNVKIRSKMLIPKIIQQLKTVTIKLVNEYDEQCEGQGLHNMQPLRWQRNYYEHIIRNEKEYYNICQYIENNPANWEEDCLNNC